MRARRAALIAVLGLAALATPPGAAAARGPVPAGVLDLPTPVVPPRDVVLETPSASAARMLARGSASATRYPVNDGEGRTVAIDVTPACEVTCTDADPQALANFLGSLVHGDEMSALRLEVVTDGEMAGICGFGVLACYFSGQNRIVLNGNDTGRGGLTQQFLLAHEYGHHLAQHRLNPPFTPTIHYGTKRWTSVERVCQGSRQGRYFPGGGGDRYWANPGEAFAEAFAFNRFPGTSVDWEWSESLRPNAAAFAAIRQDALRPWTERTRIAHRGSMAGRKRVGFRRVRTPLDGVLTVRLVGPRGSDVDLWLRDARGRTLRSSEGRGAREQVSFLVCGQARFTAVARRVAGRGGRYHLIFHRP